MADTVEEALAAIRADCGWAHEVLEVEIERLRAELTALRAVREAAERYVKAWDAKDAADCAEGPDDAALAMVQQRGREKSQAFYLLRASLASTRPASGETAPAASSDPNPEGNRRE